jgi:3-phosphoshikimate 1-carboxyvinyltransferase
MCPHPRISVEVPGSKSMTNRALLLAALAKGETRLSGVLFSNDSLVFLQALEELGFSISQDADRKTVTIQGLGGDIKNSGCKAYLGSAGTAARFITAMTAMSSGKFSLDASEQMKHRPMRELLDALEQLGAHIDYHGQEGTFPFCITGIGQKKDAGVSLNIDRSSQFLSALLMTAPICFDNLEITLTGERNARSYVEMTERMMKQFGHPGVVRLSEDSYRVKRAAYQAQDYEIEPDVSAACYFYAMAAITGGETCVQRMSLDSLQGDTKFLQVLEKMGCTRTWRQGSLYLKGPEPGHLKGIEVDMSDFSDQALTLAAIAPYANSPVHIQNVSHIRGQECDRLQAIRVNLERMQVKCKEETDGIWIEPSKPQAAVIETFQDHRVAMAFAVTGVGTDGIEISNPQCCSKTFPGYFDILDGVLDAQGKSVKIENID